MALTVGQLNSYFTGLITDLMTIERQPLTRLQESRDQVVIKRSVYTDVKTKLKDLQDAAKALRDTPLTSLAINRQAVVSNAPNGATVISASAANTADLGLYQISVTSLAREHRVWSNQQTATDQALNLNGEITLNGVPVSVAETDTLNALAAKINGKTFADGREITASVVDRRLVLAARHSGTAATITASDTQGTVLQSLGLVDDEGALIAAHQQSATNAVFKVNGLEVTRSANSGIADVIDGATLTLAADAEGKSATLTVSADTSAARAAIQAFVDKFNSLQSYLQDRTAVTSTTQNGVKTFTRGELADDNIFGDLRSDLFGQLMSDIGNAGALKNLREIGLSVDDNLQATISDSAKLEDALTQNFDNAKALFEGVMGRIDTTLGGFTGTTTGYVTEKLKSLSSALDDTDSEIADLNIRLNERQQSLIDQFGQMQALLIEMSYQQQQWSTIYSTYSQLS